MYFSDVCRSEDILEIDVLIKFKFSMEFPVGGSDEGGSKSQLLSRHCLDGACLDQCQVRMYALILMH